MVATSVDLTQSHAYEISPRNDVVDLDSAASENQNPKSVADVTVQMNVARIFAMCPYNETALSSNTRASSHNHIGSTKQSSP